MKIADITSAELRERISQVERELETIEAKLPSALRAVAESYLGGRTTDEVSSLRTQTRKLKDVLLGLQQLAQATELAKLEAEIGQRESACEKEAERVQQLRTIASRGTAVLEGAGNHFAIAQRRDKEDRNADFSTYERANIALIEERKVVEALKQRLCALRGEHYHAPSPPFVGA